MLNLALSQQCLKNCKMKYFFLAHSYPFPSLYVTCKKISKCQNITLKIRVRRFLLYKHISTRTTEVISAEILFLMLLVIIYNFIAYV